MKSLARFVLIGMIAASVPLFADIKVKTRTTVMGHANESSVYIQGARKRDEMQFGPVKSVTILQCDQKRLITVDEACHTYTVTPLDEEENRPVQRATSSKPSPKAEPAEDKREGGVITLTNNTIDTGEREKMFGYTARHIKTATSIESSPDACS